MGGEMKKLSVLCTVCITVCILSLGLSFQAEANQGSMGAGQPSAEEMQQIMNATFGAMVPMMAKMTEIMIKTQLEEAQKKETAEKLAKFKKNLYDALTKQGFTKAEAFQIMLNTAPPSATPAMK